MVDLLTVLALIVVFAVFGCWAVAATVMAVLSKPPQEADHDDETPRG